jgi:hypothetical protein
MTSPERRQSVSGHGDAPKDSIIAHAHSNNATTSTTSKSTSSFINVHKLSKCLDQMQQSYWMRFHETTGTRSSDPKNGNACQGRLLELYDSQIRCSSNDSSNSSSSSSSSNKNISMDDVMTNTTFTQAKVPPTFKRDNHDEDNHDHPTPLSLPQQLQEEEQEDDAPQLDDDDDDDLEQWLDNVIEDTS